jgi:hypothetical protein
LAAATTQGEIKQDVGNTAGSKVFSKEKILRKTKSVSTLHAGEGRKAKIGSVGPRTVSEVHLGAEGYYVFISKYMGSQYEMREYKKDL